MNRVSHKQLVSIQVLRAIAALSVVIGHIIGKVKHEYSEVPDIYLSFWQISAFGVDIFFIISGVVMVLVSQTDSHDIVQIKRFLKHRLFRIYPVYWVAITCYLAMKLTQVGGLSGIDLEHITFSYLLLPTQTSSGGYYPILGVGWTLVFEVFFYVCYAFTMLVALKYRIAVFLLLFVPLMLIGLSSGTSNAFVNMYFSPLLLEFMAGMLIGFIIKRGHTIPGYLASIILVSSLVMLSATMALSAPYVSFENLNQWRVIFW
ncbi:MAG: acyltransferase, partial [Thalassotalea sp.]|nr:acyltransferase [Thalassotalea sp.]